MIIYEVNLNIASNIFSAYLRWLKSHIQEMLQFQGFCSAKIFREQGTNADQEKITIHYEIQNQKHLDDYLNNFAAKMREDGLKKFGDQFSATRRIFVWDESEKFC